MRTYGWASHRTPWWVFAVIAVVIAGAFVVSLDSSPSQAQRAGDLRGYFGDVNAAIESCAGGLRDAQTAVRTVTAGDKADAGQAASILDYNARNCSPANNQPLEDFTSYQVPQSLSSFNLDQADNDVITWAFDAQEVQNAMLAVLKTGTPGAHAALTAAMAKMNAQRAAIYAVWDHAQRVTGAHIRMPDLPANHVQA